MLKVLGVSGDLLPRHMQIFKSNQFFYGLSIPEPEHVEALSTKLPNADNVTLDFLNVSAFMSLLNF